MLKESAPINPEEVDTVLPRFVTDPTESPDPIVDDPEMDKSEDIAGPLIDSLEPWIEPLEDRELQTAEQVTEKSEPSLTLLATERDPESDPQAPVDTDP